MSLARFRAYIYIAITVFIWGIASVVIKLTLQGIPPTPFLTYRFFIASLCALPFLPRILRLFHKDSETRMQILLYAFLSCPLALGILFVGLNETSVVNSALLGAAEPVVLAIIGAKIFHDHLSHKARVGVGITIIGVILTIIEPVLFNYDGGTLVGNMLISVYIVIDIVSIVLLKKLLKKNVDAFALTQLSFLMGFIFFLPLLFREVTPLQLVSFFQQLPIQYHLGVFYMALLSGVLAYTLRAKAQKTLNISELSIFGYIQPVITTLLALLILSEHISALYLLGALFIGIGVFVVETKKRHHT